MSAGDRPGGRSRNGQTARLRSPDGGREDPIRTAQTTLAPPPPPPLPGAGTALFFDLDGTLVDLVARPEETTADAALRTLLAAARDRLEGRLAIVSGRSLAQLDAILGDLARHLVLAGSHGAELRLNGETLCPPRPAGLDAATAAMRAFAAGREGLLLEEKSFGTAFHYRLAPSLEPGVRRFARTLAQECDLFVQEGKMMVELRLAGHDKGEAVRRLMAAPPLAGGVPVFAGDDLTDESGFAAAGALGGYGVLVGAARPSAARFGLPDPGAVRRWLAAMTAAAA